MSKSTLSIDGNLRRGALLLALLVCVLYQGTIRSGFQYDDFHSIVRNPHLIPANVGQFFLDPGLFSVNPESTMYRPLLLATFTLNRWMSGDEPWSYHLANVLLHAGNAAIILWLLRLLGLTAGTSALAATLFAIHPINSEAVAYVSSRSELLASLGMFLFCGLALTCSTRWTHRLATVVAMGAALLSKSVAIVAPVLAIVGLASDAGVRAKVRSLLPVGSAVVAIVVVYLFAIRSLVTRAVVDSPVRDMVPQLATQTKALGYYIWLTVMPIRLSVEHQFLVSRDLDPTVAMGGAFLLSLVLVAWRAHPWRWGVAWWLICLLPTIVVPLIVLVNEHRLYAASVGGFAMIATAIQSQRSEGRPVAVILIAAYTIMLALLTVGRIEVWQSERSVWEDAATKAPASLKAQLRWADALAFKGDVELAEAAYLRALALRSHHPATRNNLGRMYLVQGRWDEAQTQFGLLLNVSPDNVPARMNLAQILFRQGRLDEARVQYEAVMAYETTHGRAQLRIAQIGLRQDSPAAQVLRWLEQAEAAGETSVDLHVSRGIVLRRLGRGEAALAAYRAALAKAPASADVWYNLGNLYVEQENRTEAVQAFTRAIECAAEDDVIRQSAIDRLRALK